jgi:hypothetical protein
VSSGELARREESSGLRASRPSAPQGIAIDQEAVFRALKLDPRIPEVQALIVVAQRYELDLVLGHLCLVNGTVMIRKNGLLHIAHRSGDLDGIEVDLEEKTDRFVATARIWRKTKTRPFCFTDECMKNERVQSPRKRARTRAVRNALAEAFDVSVPVYEEEDRPLPRLPVRNSELPVADWEPAVEGRPVENVPRGPGEGDGPAGNATDAAPSPGLPPKARALMARFAALAMPEDVRHELIGWATGGRSQSVKEITDDEASQLHEALHSMKRGTLVEGLPSMVVEWFESRPM